MDNRTLLLKAVSHEFLKGHQKVIKIKMECQVLQVVKSFSTRTRYFLFFFLKSKV